MCVCVFVCVRECVNSFTMVLRLRMRDYDFLGNRVKMGENFLVASGTNIHIHPLKWFPTAKGWLIKKFRDTGPR